MFVDQIRTEKTLDLLTHEYVEQMARAGKAVAPKEKLTRAQFLKNRFIAENKMDLSVWQKILRAEIYWQRLKSSGALHGHFKTVKEGEIR